MQTLREEVNAKLSRIFNDLKDLQKTIIHLRQAERKAVEGRISIWQGLGREVSRQWDGVAAVEEISAQREKR